MKTTVPVLPRVSGVCCCYHCGKVIRGKVVIRRPFALDPDDFSKAYHPTCYAKSEKAAARELSGK